MKPIGIAARAVKSWILKARVSGLRVSVRSKWNRAMGKILKVMGRFEDHAPERLSD